MAAVRECYTACFSIIPAHFAMIPRNPRRFRAKADGHFGQEEETEAPFAGPTRRGAVREVQLQATPEKPSAWCLKCPSKRRAQSQFQSQSRFQSQFRFQFRFQSQSQSQFRSRSSRISLRRLAGSSRCRPWPRSQSLLISGSLEASCEMPFSNNQSLR